MLAFPSVNLPLSLGRRARPGLAQSGAGSTIVRGFGKAAAIGVVALAATLTAANAAEEARDSRASGETVFSGDRPAPPRTTGSVQPSSGGSIMVDSYKDCEPGKYWTVEAEDREVIVACK